MTHVELNLRKLLGFRLLTASQGSTVGAKIGNKNNAPPIASKVGGKIPAPQSAKGSGLLSSKIGGKLGVKGASPVT